MSARAGHVVGSLLALLAAACTVPPGAGVATVTREQLVGNWTRVTTSACSERYPARIRFDERGIYFGEPGQPGMFIEWDSGRYQVRGPGRIMIATANDAEVEYEVSGGDDVLTVVDAGGCRFEYRRTSD